MADAAPGLRPRVATARDDVPVSQPPHQRAGRLRRTRLVRWAAVPQRRRILTFVGLIVAIFTFDFFLAVRHGFFDLNVYHAAVNYWIHDSGALYDFVLPYSTYGFTYPPFAAVSMIPMAITPWHVAIAISAITCLAVSIVVVYWLVDPVARRHGWTRWYAVGLAVVFAAAFEPLRETFLFGQVNMYLVFLVAADLILLVRKGSRFGGIGIGLATAIKLTPALFIVYLVVTKRWRAAAVAAGTAGGATLFAAAVAPDASRVFFTDALWNTDRIGALAFISNQSLNGAVARLNAADPSTILWLGAVLAIMVLWLVRVRRAAAAGDEMTGFALTGIVSCLISPITWVHHLVWVGPAILLLLDRAMVAESKRRKVGLLVFMGFSYALLSSRVVWEFNLRWGNPFGWTMSNAYVLLSIALLIALPIAQPAGTATAVAPVDDSAERVPEVERDPEVHAKPEPYLGPLDRELAGLLHDDLSPAAVKADAVPIAEGQRPGVAR